MQGRPEDEDGERGSPPAGESNRVDRLDRYQRRRRWLGFPIGVVYKFIDDQGVYLAALITYYGFLSLFPLFLLLASITGFVLQNNPSAQQRVLDSTLSQFPIVRDQLTDPQGLRGSGVAVVVGGLIALYGALGVTQALQNAMNIAWAVPRHRRPNPFKARARSLLLIVTAGYAVIGTTVLSAVAGSGAAYGARVRPVLGVLATVVAVLLNAVVCVVVFRIATARRLRTRDVLPGAVTAAVIWQVLQLVGTAYVGSVFKGASTTYGVFALVFGLLAWIFLAAVGLVLCVELNVVRVKRLYPRALLTPFTDNVDLTPADKQAYAEAANAQRLKGFESIQVRFANDGQHLSARRRIAAGNGDGVDAGIDVDVDAAADP